jgi:hypothetical protein
VKRRGPGSQVDEQRQTLWLGENRSELSAIGVVKLDRSEYAKPDHSYRLPQFANSTKSEPLRIVRANSAPARKVSPGRLSREMSRLEAVFDFFFRKRCPGHR